MDDRRSESRNGPDRRLTSRLARAFFEHAHVGMAILCLEDLTKPASLRVAGLNPAASRISDVPDAAVGKRVDEDFPDIAKTDLPARIAAVIRDGVAADLGEVAGVYDPSRTFSIQAFPIPPHCCGILFHDVTERRRGERALRESEQRFRKIFAASQAAICVFDPAGGTFIDVNPRFVEMLGFQSSDPIIGRRLGSFGMWAGAGEYERLLDALRRERALREATVSYRTLTGQVRLAMVALELIEIEGKECVLGLFWRA